MLAALLFANSFTSIMIVTVGLGVAKGIRSVYMTLVIPSYVPLAKLPSASGIQMMFNGLILTCFGPLIGISLFVCQLLLIALPFILYVVRVKNSRLHTISRKMVRIASNYLYS